MKKQTNKQKQSTKTPELDGVRLDKWLWAARFCKTRTIAREWVLAGKVHYNQQRAKPSKVVEIGAQVRVPTGYDEKIVTIKAIMGRRQSAQIAQTLFEETQASIEQREKNNQARKLSAFHSPRPDTRPDKKQRRQIIQFKQK